MAKIVLGVATSHGPMLATPPDQWHLRATDDRAMPVLWYRGERFTFDQLVRLRAPEHLERQIAIDVWRRRHAACQRALQRLAQVFVEASPDAAIIIGDDQMEIFTDYDMPAFSIYYGETIENTPFTDIEKAAMTPGMLIAEGGHHGPRPETYPGMPALARHLIGAMMRAEFDVAAARRLPSSAPFPTSGEARLHAIPQAYLQSGTSEAKNWMTAAGALLGAGLEMTLVDYVPCYRSEAGTGTAQAFAYWA